MSNTDKVTPEPDDRDLTCLFEAQSVSVPATLDAQILTAARTAIVPGMPGHDHPYKVTEQTYANDTEEPDTPVGYVTPGRWFAIAATLLVGIAVTPLLLRSPESALTRADATEAASISNAAQELVPLQASKSSPAGTESRSTGGITDAREAQDQAAWVNEAKSLIAKGRDSEVQGTSPQMVSPESNSNTLPASSVTAIEVDNTRQLKRSAADFAVPGSSSVPSRLAAEDSQVPEVFRDTPEDWVEHIRKLEAQGLFDTAREEYERFRPEYPDHEPEFRLPTR